MPYFIKLSGTPLPVSTNECLSFKIKYDRTQDPTPDNPLNGLFDYTGFASFLRDYLSGMKGKWQAGDREKLEKNLLSETRKQVIACGKYKLVSKPVTQKAREARADSLRLEGQATNVQINHGHFLEHQRNSATGVSNESLAWVVKLKVPPKHKKREAFENVLKDDGLRQAINNQVRDCLGRGDALELVNDAIKRVLQARLYARELPAVPARLALHRPGLLPDTVVVVGENTVLGPSSGPGVGQAASGANKNPDRVRKYRDFSANGPKDSANPVEVSVTKASRS